MDYWQEAQVRDDLQIVGQPRPLPLDAAGNLSNCADWRGNGG
jgi:hypothetical protein